MADTSYTPPQESRGRSRPVSGYRIRANFSNANSWSRPEAVLEDYSVTGSTDSTTEQAKLICCPYYNNGMADLILTSRFGEKPTVS